MSCIYTKTPETEEEKEEDKKYEAEFLSKLNSTNPPINAHSYLLATPYTLNSRYNFGKTISTNFFFTNFFSNSLIADRIENEFFNSPKYAQSQVALFVGYKGCGKTTFVNWLLIDKHYLLINFEKYVSNKATVHDNMVFDICDLIKDDIKMETLTKQGAKTGAIDY